MEVVAALALVAALVAGGVALGPKLAAMESAMDALLRPIAEKLGATFHKGDLGAPTNCTFTTPDGVQVKISVSRTKYRSNDKQLTRVELTPPPPGLPVYGVTGGTLGGVMHKEMFAKDIKVGTKAIDDNFSITGKDEALVRRVWTQPFASEILRAFPESRFTSNGTMLKVENDTVSEAVITKQLELGLLVARFDAFGVRMLAELPEAKLGPDAGGFPQAEVPGPSRIVVGPVVHDGTMRTRVEMAGATDVPDDARRRIEQLGAVVETSAEATTIAWPSIEADRERLTSAIEILRKLASGTSLGAFR